jgi:antitoxin MazE
MRVSHHWSDVIALAQSIYVVYTLIMETNIQKWGNSLGVRLPKSIAHSKSFKEGSRVSISALEDGLSIKVVTKKQHTLSDLLKRVTKSNTHTELDWASARGNEVW